MSAQCRHGLIRHECWQCRDEASQATHVSQVFAGGLVTAVQQLEALEKECAALRHDIARHVAICAEQAEEIEQLRALLLSARPYIQPLKTYDDRCLDIVVAIDAALRREET
ncbi:MAG: hypothetical protein MUC42_07430 [Bryobacter sp.]|jgi:hypothetical protein|nr:hypothetical protein [Bryobacter sp.]